MKVTGAIRKLKSKMGNNDDIQKSHVLFIKEGDNFYSFLVDDDIINEGNMSEDEDFKTVKDSLTEIDINEEAFVLSRTSDRSFITGTIPDLLVQDLSKTFTDDHSTYNS